MNFIYLSLREEADMKSYEPKGDVSFSIQKGKAETEVINDATQIEEKDEENQNDEKSRYETVNVNDYYLNKETEKNETKEHESFEI